MEEWFALYGGCGDASGGMVGLEKVTCGLQGHALTKCNTFTELVNVSPPVLLLPLHGYTAIQ